MNEEQLNKRKSFRYNLSFYYQSTIIYFIVFVLYVIIRGEFVEDSFKLITSDPIIYFFALIVLISLGGLLFNLYKQKHIEVTEDGIAIISRFGKKIIPADQIKSIKLSRERRARHALRMVRIKIKQRTRPLMIRLLDYENQDELEKRLRELKAVIENQ